MQASLDPWGREWVGPVDSPPVPLQAGWGGALSSQRSQTEAGPQPHEGAEGREGLVCQTVSDRQCESTGGGWPPGPTSAPALGPRPGVAVHLFPHAAFPRLRTIPVPEILRTPLEELCLQVCPPPRRAPASLPRAPFPSRLFFFASDMNYSSCEQLYQSSVNLIEMKRLPLMQRKTVRIMQHNQRNAFFFVQIS